MTKVNKKIEGEREREEEKEKGGRELKAFIEQEVGTAVEDIITFTNKVQSVAKVK